MGGAVKRIITLLIGTIFLAGCAQDIWDKPGGSQAEFNQDSGSCQMFALSMPQQRAQQLPPVYQANTTYNGTYTPMGAGYGQVNGTANTTYQAQPNPGQGFADLGAALGNAARQQQAMRACMTAHGYTLRQK
jgi:hypothetical protein